MLKVGDKITLTNEAIENYGEEYQNREFTITHIAFNENEHMGYDNSLDGMALYDLSEFDFSVYDYEIN